MRRRAAPIVIAALDVVGYAFLGVVGLVDAAPGQADPLSTVLFGIAVGVFAAMGALLVRRVPENRVGALLLATATAQTAGIGLLTYASLGASAAPQWPGAAVASALGDLAYTAPFVIALIGIPLVFPDGHLPSPASGWRSP